MSSTGAGSRSSGGLAWQLPSSLLPHPALSLLLRLWHMVSVGLVRLSCFWHGLLRGETGSIERAALGLRRVVSDRKPGSGAPGQGSRYGTAGPAAGTGLVCGAGSSASLHGHLGAEAARMWLWLWCDACGPRWEGDGWGCSLPAYC